MTDYKHRLINKLIKVFITWIDLFKIFLKFGI